MKRRLATAKQTRSATSAVGQNLTSITLDLAGLIPGGSTAATLGALGVSGLGLVNNAARGDVGGIGLSIADFHITSARPLTAQYQGISKWARIIPVVGTIASAASLLSTANDIREDFNACMSKGS